MRIGKALVAAAVLALTAPATAALAHDDGYSRHQRDHRAHRGFHRDVGEAHSRAHREGFDSRFEHRAYHRALRDLHAGFHEDHSGTRHDHYTWRRQHRSPYSYRPCGSSYGYWNR